MERSTAVVIVPLLSMLPVMDRVPPVPALAAMTPEPLLVSIPLMFRDSLYELSIDSIRIVPLLVRLLIANCPVPTLPLPCIQTVADAEALLSSVEFPSTRIVCDPALLATLSEALNTYTGPTNAPPLKLTVPFCQVNRPPAPLAVIDPPSWLSDLPDP